MKEEPPIITKEEPPIISKDSTATTCYPRVNESFRKPNKKNWVGTLFKCVVGCKEGVRYWDEGGNEFDKNLNLILNTVPEKSSSIVSSGCTWKCVVEPCSDDMLPDGCRWIGR